MVLRRHQNEGQGPSDLSFPVPSLWLGACTAVPVSAAERYDTLLRQASAAGAVVEHVAHGYVVLGLASVAAAEVLMAGFAVLSFVCLAVHCRCSHWWEPASFVARDQADCSEIHCEHVHQVSWGSRALLLKKGPAVPEEMKSPRATLPLDHLLWLLSSPCCYT